MLSSKMAEHESAKKRSKRPWDLDAMPRLQATWHVIWGRDSQGQLFGGLEYPKSGMCMAARHRRRADCNLPWIGERKNKEERMEENSFPFF